jgi:hypothetical protein
MATVGMNKSNLGPKPWRNKSNSLKYSQLQSNQAYIYPFYRKLNVAYNKKENMDTKT